MQLEGKGMETCICKNKPHVANIEAAAAVQQIDGS